MQASATTMPKPATASMREAPPTAWPGPSSTTQVVQFYSAPVACFLSALDTQYRMQLVLNAPMAAHDIVASLWGEGVAGQVIAGSRTGSVSQLSGSGNLGRCRQVWPAMNHLQRGYVVADGGGLAPTTGGWL